MSPRKPWPLSAEFRKLRTASGLTQADAAKLLKKDLRTIKRWECGDTEPEPLAVDYLRHSTVRLLKEGPSEFTFIDLFAGIGGMRLGFEAAGGRCVFTSEWDKFAQQTYQANFGGERPFGDITTLDVAKVPDHDVLVAGFPCQPFSLAGVSKKNSLGRPHGFECTTQGTLFFEIEKIIRAKQPKAFLLENVKNLQSHDQKRTFATIMRVLQRELGYTIQHRVIDARKFVPQHRERIFIVGFKEDVGFDFDDVAFPADSLWPKVESILHAGNANEVEKNFTDSKGFAASKYVLSDHLWKYLQDYAAKHLAKGNGFGFGLVGPKDVSRTLSARYHKDGSEILVRRGRGNPRRLTPRECARLMGFDFGNRRWEIKVSDTQAYRQFGNAVVPPVVEAIARAMRPYLLGQRRAKRSILYPLAS